MYISIEPVLSNLQFVYLQPLLLYIKYYLCQNFLFSLCVSVFGGKGDFNFMNTHDVENIYSLNEYLHHIKCVRFHGK